MQSGNAEEKGQGDVTDALRSQLFDEPGIDHRTHGHCAGAGGEHRRHQFRAMEIVAEDLRHQRNIGQQCADKKGDGDRIDG